MLFNTQQAAEAVQKQDVLFLPAGIHENVILSNIRIDKTTNQNDFIEFTFTNPDGRSLKRTIFTPTRFPEQTDDQFQNTINNAVNLMTDVFECYYEKGTKTKVTESFTEYIAWIKQILEEADLSKTLRIKATYKRNGFVTLQEGSKYTVIEPTTANPVKVVEMPSDMFKWPTPDKEGGKVVDDTSRFLAATGQSTTQPTGTQDDLPF